jgi:hypothetical protein
MIVVTDAQQWHVLSERDLAGLRYSLIRELSWIDWGGKPQWWWTKEHRTLLDVKLATLLRPEEE